MHLIYGDRTRVWEEKDPRYNYIGIEKLERKYDDKGNPLDNWEATLTAYNAEDIQTLLDFQSGSDLVVKYTIQGRLDRYPHGLSMVKLYSCIPIRGWYEDLVNPRDGSLVTYRLLVTCQVKHDLSELIYGKNDDT